MRRTFRSWSAALLWLTACSSAGERFVAVGDGVVRDARTGLEWTRRDDGAGLDWNRAEAYCQRLAIEAGRWRLPAIEELRSLYLATTKSPCGDAMCGIDPAFTLTSPYVWSATAQDATVPALARTYLDFQFGTELSPTITPRLVRRVLCVRTP